MAKSKKTQRLDELAALIRECTRCRLHESRTLAVPGDGKYSARFMIVGEGPGRDEDRSGLPFVGASGQFLNDVLAGTGLDRRDFFITNIVKCRPPGNRTPRRDEITTCTTNYLREQIALLKPKLVVLLGGVAVKTLLGAKSVEEVRGRIVEHEGRRFFATYHPAVRFYREELAVKVREDFAQLQRELKKI